MASASGYSSLEDIYRDDTILAKTLVVKNVPKKVTEDSLQNFLEVVCKEDVDCLIYSEECYPPLAVFEKVVTDLQKCQDKLQTKKLENETVQLEHIGSVKGLFLPDVPETCTHDCLLFYFESKKRSGGSEDHVEGVNINIIGGKRYAVVTISDKSVIEAILSKPEHKPNGQQEVKIEPYFSSVHDYLLEKLKENVTLSGQARKGTEERPAEPRREAMHPIKSSRDTNESGIISEEDTFYRQIAPTSDLNRGHGQRVNGRQTETDYEPYELQPPNRENAHERPHNAQDNKHGQQHENRSSAKKWNFTKEQPLTSPQIVMLKIDKLQDKCSSLDVHIILNEKYGNVIINSDSEEDLKEARLKMFNVLERIREKSVPISKPRSEFLALSKTQFHLRKICIQNKLWAVLESNVERCCLTGFAFSLPAAERSVKFALGALFVETVRLLEGQEHLLTCSDWTAKLLTVFVLDSNIVIEGFVKEAVDETKRKIVKSLQNKPATPSSAPTLTSAPAPTSAPKPTPTSAPKPTPTITKTSTLKISLNGAQAKCFQTCFEAELRQKIDDAITLPDAVDETKRKIVKSLQNKPATPSSAPTLTSAPAPTSAPKPAPTSAPKPTPTITKTSKLKISLNGAQAKCFQTCFEAELRQKIENIKGTFNVNVEKTDYPMKLSINVEGEEWVTKETKTCIEQIWHEHVDFSKISTSELDIWLLMRGLDIMGRTFFREFQKTHSCFIDVTKDGEISPPPPSSTVSQSPTVKETEPVDTTSYNEEKYGKPHPQLYPTPSQHTTPSEIKLPPQQLLGTTQIREYVYDPTQNVVHMQAVPPQATSTSVDFGEDFPDNVTLPMSPPHIPRSVNPYGEPSVPSRNVALGLEPLSLFKRYGEPSETSQNMTLDIEPVNPYHLPYQNAAQYMQAMRSHQIPDDEDIILAMDDFQRATQVRDCQNDGNTNSVIVNNTKVVVMKGTITEQMASALVNIVAPSKNIKEESVVSKEFVKAGGQKLVDNYEAAKLSSVDMVTVTEASGELNCDIVLHVTLGKDGARHCNKVVRQAMNQVFDECRNWGCKYVAFPPLGVGRLYRYPAVKVALCMLKETVTFLNTGYDAKKITFVIYDDETYSIFDKEFDEYSKNPNKYEESSSDSSDDNNGISELRRQMIHARRPTARPRPPQPANRHKALMTAQKQVIQNLAQALPAGIPERRSKQVVADAGPGMNKFRQIGIPNTQPTFSLTTILGYGEGASAGRHNTGNPDTRRPHRHRSSGDGVGNKDEPARRKRRDVGYRRDRSSGYDTEESSRHFTKNTHSKPKHASRFPPDKSSPKLKVTVFAESREKCEKARKELGKKIKDDFLYEESVEKKYKISRDAKEKIATVIVKNNIKSIQGKDAYAIRGYKENVLKARNDILMVILEGRKSSDTPSNPEERQNRRRKHHRETVEFVTVMADDEPETPRYWKNFKPGETLKNAFSSVKLLLKYKKYLKVDIDGSDPIYKAILSMVNKTWDPAQIGQGKDAKGLDIYPYQKMFVLKIQRIENLELYREYAVKRISYFLKLKNRGVGRNQSIESLPGSSGKIATDKYANGVLLKDTYTELNEHYFFHGTKPDNVDIICNQGLDSRLGSGKAMFGSGVYGAECATKADQYTDDASQRTFGQGQEKKMFLIRMILGQSFLCKNPNPHKYLRPPCMTCQKDDCKKHVGNFDSVVGDNGKLFREFVVYHPEQCYPEYLITYERR